MISWDKYNKFSGKSIWGLGRSSNKKEDLGGADRYCVIYGVVWNTGFTEVEMTFSGKNGKNEHKNIDILSDVCYNERVSISKVILA